MKKVKKQYKKPNFIFRALGGFTAPIRGLGFLLKNFGLIRYAVFPMIINAILVVIIYIFGTKLLLGYMDRLIPDEKAWYWMVLFWIAAVFTVILFLLVTAIIFYIIGGIICLPFNELLSQRVEAIVLGKAHEEPFSFRVITKDIGYALTHEILKSTIYLFILVFILPLFFIGLFTVVVSIIFTVIFNIITWMFLAYDYFDHPLGRRRIPFADKMRFVYKNLPSSLGFGAAAFLFLYVPFLNLILIPLNVIGGTKLFFEIQKWYGEMEYRDISPRGKKRKELKK
ncbi:MAG: EI24 domain-containing protein [Deltaproteobacteria bacterium]|uniref:EI24 domain-containing protein n=1 Tax=Candidatus Zymogenus saltonus TaxID=2844893 RepID=A0A9D8KEG8_9DELT|nr:EI24 domain-containing protein [Candidatus Zymogenus saltonus]